MRQIAISLALLATVVPAWTAPACSCSIVSTSATPKLPNGDPVPDRDELTRQQFLFVGTALSLSDAPAGLPEPKSGLAVRNVADFRIEEVWRGPEHLSTLRVYTSFLGGGCGFPFKPGIKYLIFAEVRDDGLLFTSICSRTTEYTSASALLGFVKKILGPSKSPPRP